MTRVPKFRAWHKVMSRMSEVLAISWERQKVRIKHLRGSTHITVLFDDVIFMQSTGLKDKNGVEIYEGDVTDYNRNIYVVVKVGSSLGLAFLKNGDKTSFKPLIEDMVNFDRLEVIGNIYENKELLSND